MIEKALTGSKRYWGWIGFLMIFIIIGTLFYIRQYQVGLGITGLSRDVPWGFYIAQFTFLVGVAASAVMVVLPYYLHNYKAFGKITVLGEFVAISSVIMCMTFIFVDMGQPFRILNVFLHPTPNSLMFWDTIVLSGYLVLNVLISYATFSSERKGIAPPKWIKPFIILSIPWAVSIHTVTAFLYSGLEGRAFWLTAILAPRFLASAFAAGPALLIILVLIVRKVSRLQIDDEPIRKLGVIVAYAMAVNVFFVLMEVFTGIYSDIPEHIHHFEYLYLGLDGYSKLAPWMWVSSILAVLSLVLLLVPRYRNNLNILVVACVAVFVSLWIDKGLGMVVTGFVPNPMGHITEYWPTVPEFFITLAIYALGALILTVLYKVVISIREQVAGYH
jgi:Ni/Fe-hydrogenase subunit HybB-like protein